MTTDDPFTNPPAAPTQNLRAAPPPMPVYPPAFPIGGAPPAKPSGVATAAIVLTGAYLLASLLTALRSQATVDNLRETLGGGSDAATLDVGSTLVGLLGLVVGIGAFVCLALWMSRIRANRTQLGRAPGGPPAVEWWGWFIPIANFVLPALGMRAITRGIVGAGRLMGWWLPFCATFLLSAASSTLQFSAVDVATGAVKDLDALDSIVTLSWASALLLLTSWLFLVTIIRRTTERHLEVASA